MDVKFNSSFTEDTEKVEEIDLETDYGDEIQVEIVIVDGPMNQMVAETWETYCSDASTGWPSCWVGQGPGQLLQLRGRERLDVDSRGRAGEDQEETKTDKYNLAPRVPVMVIGHCLHPFRDSVSSILFSCFGTRF